jgi:hypothetical protein
MSERRQKAGGRRQEAESRRQRAEGRRQKAGGRRQKAVVCVFTAFCLLPSAFLFGALLGSLLAGCTRKVDTQAKPDIPPIQFRDVASSAGLALVRSNGAFGKRWMPETMSGGGAILDFDNDGWMDILIVDNAAWPGRMQPGTQGSTLHLYHNNHNGTFTDVTGQAGLETHFYGMGIAVGDYDNDGYEDLFVTAVGRSYLFHNVPDGRGGRKFVDVTAQSGIDDKGWSTSAAWVDYDRDGKLDLFVCHYLRWSPETDIFCGSMIKTYCRPQEYSGESCRLYHNDGNGHFTDVTARAGLTNMNSKALGVCVCDLDGDGLPDLVVANDMEPNCVYHNNGNGTFTEIGLESGIALDQNGKSRAGMGVDIADYRHNGTLGLAIGNFSFEGIALYDVRNASNSEERSRSAGIFYPSYPYITFGLLFADFDNDGWPDLFATNGHIEDTIARTNPGQSYPQPCLLFRNRGDGTFADVSSMAGTAVTQPLVGRGVCRVDFDNDGKPDILLIPNIGPLRLLHNETPVHNHWLGIRLIGTKSNRDALGASVEVEANGVKQTAYAHGGASYLSGNDPRLYFGLGASAPTVRISVRWPSGKQESWRSTACDRILTLTEGTSSRPLP